MSNKLNHNIILGAASMAAGIIKTLTSAFMPRQKSWPEKAKDAASQFASNASNRINRKILLGTVAGGIIGVTTALLLAPKSGAALINGFYKPTKVAHSKKSVATASRKARYQPKKSSHPKEETVAKKIKRTVKKATSQ
jgi:gas vesicle protein